MHGTIRAKTNCFFRFFLDKIGEFGSIFAVFSWVSRGSLSVDVFSNILYGTVRYVRYVRFRVQNVFLNTGVAL